FFSCVAGFQEPGETLEECVRREAKEETGVDIGRIVYHSCQPWPFPSQLMVGFVATARGSESVRPEEDEFEEIRWFTRAEILPALDASAKGTSSFSNPDPKADLVLAPPWAVAHHIIKAWAHNEIDMSGQPGEARI
ncbi:NADH pyrophosphatase, partial [Gonapodya sp. JEL0774]